jgi:outer membrane protein TolC
LHARPEYQQYAATRERLGRQADVDAAQIKPQVSAFARLGYGRPGLNALSPNFTSYWLAGLQLQWTPWDWGTTDRQREVLALQQQIVVADEAAFTGAVRRSVQADLAAIDQLDGAMALDDRIIALREHIERETNLRLQEGVVTASEYVDRANDLFMARLTRGDHRIALAQARAHFLTTLGIETRQ